MNTIDPPISITLIEKLEKIKYTIPMGVNDVQVENNLAIDKAIAIVRKFMGDASTRKDEGVKVPETLRSCGNGFTSSPANYSYQDLVNPVAPSEIPDTGHAYHTKEYLIQWCAEQRHKYIARTFQQCDETSSAKYKDAQKKQHLYASFLHYLRATKPVSIDLEAAAIALCETGGNTGFANSWIEKSEKTKEAYRISARAAFKAAGVKYE